MRKPIAIFSMLLAVAVLPLAAGAVELTLYCNTRMVPSLEEVVRDWEIRTGNTVKILTVPNSAALALPKYEEHLLDERSDIDIYQIDSIWTGILQEHFIDFRPRVGGMEKLHLPRVVSGYTIGDRLVAMPMFVDIGLVFYRRDLLEKYRQPLPFTWNDLITTGRRIAKAERAAGGSGMWGLVFQGRATESLTCAALEWIHARGGGTLVDKDGAPAIHTPEAAAALREAASWMGDAVPYDVLHYGVEESRDMFMAGNAVFLRHWPHVWPLLQRDDSAVRGRVGIMPVPRFAPGGTSPGVIGGWGLAVSKYSRNQEPAVDLVAHITGPSGQKKFCLIDHHIPSLAALFDDPDIVAEIPMAIRDIAENAVARPSGRMGKKYRRASSEFSSAVRAILAGDLEAEEGLREFSAFLERLSRDGWE